MAVDRGGEPGRVPGLGEELPGLLGDGDPALRVAEIAAGDRLVQSRRRGEQARPVGLGQGRGANRGFLGAAIVGHRARRLRLGERDARTRIGKRALERGDRRQSLLGPARARLGPHELEAVVEIVRVEGIERPVDLDGLRPLVVHRSVAALDQEARLAREFVGELEGLLRLGERPDVVAQARPGRRERGVRERVPRLRGDGPLQEVAGGDLVVDAQLRQAFGVEARRLGARGQRRLDRGRVRRRDGRQGQLRAQLRSGPRRERVEIGGRSLLRHQRDRLAGGGVLEPQVEPDGSLPARGRSRDRNRGARDPPPVLPDAGEGVLAERVGLRKREVALHPRDVLARDRPQLLAGGELGRQHLARRRRDPGLLRLPGEILEAEDGDRRGAGARAVAAEGAPADPRETSAGREEGGGCREDDRPGDRRDPFPPAPQGRRPRRGWPRRAAPHDLAGALRSGRRARARGSAGSSSPRPAAGRERACAARARPPSAA